jgi:hypothetical protein
MCVGEMDAVRLGFRARGEISTTIACTSLRHGIVKKRQRGGKTEANKLPVLASRVRFFIRWGSFSLAAIHLRELQGECGSPLVGLGASTITTGLRRCYAMPRVAPVWPYFAGDSLDRGMQGGQLSDS